MSQSCSTKIIHFSAKCKRLLRRSGNHFVTFLPVLLTFCQNGNRLKKVTGAKPPRGGRTRASPCTARKSNTNHGTRRPTLWHAQACRPHPLGRRARPRVFASPRQKSGKTAVETRGFATFADGGHRARRIRAAWRAHPPRYVKARACHPDCRCCCGCGVRRKSKDRNGIFQQHLLEEREKGGA